MIKDHTIQNGMEFIKHFYIFIFTETVKILIQLIQEYINGLSSRYVTSFIEKNIY